MQTLAAAAMEYSLTFQIAMVTFNFTYDPGVTVQQALGFEIAGRIWSHFLSDAATLRVHVGMSSNLPSNVIGGALPGIASNFWYSQIRERLQTDSTSGDDRASASSLGILQSIQHTWSVNGVQDRASHLLTSMNLTRAGGKALGLISATSTALDGAIVMGNLANSQFHWNYDFTRTSAAPSGSLDFLSVALHEIGHILGFVSGVDKPGMQSSVMVSNLDPYFASQLYTSSLEGRVNYATPLDLFRVDPQLHKDMTYGSGQGSRGFAPGGTAVVAQFSTGRNTSIQGDGFQASHWKEQSTPLGIMDPAIAPRERVSISNLDLRAFDVIGWNLRNGLSASTFTTTFLNNFRTQAVQALAQRLGQTTSWVNSNLTTSPSRLVRDHTADVEAMIQSSGIYEWGTTGSGTTSTSPRRWMEIFNQMASNQAVYVNFSKVSKITPTPENPTPEADLSNDVILGVNTTAPLVSIDASNSLNPAHALSISSSATLPPNLPISSTWSPIPTQMTEAVAPSPTLPATRSASRQPASSLFSPVLNTLLGFETNPLVQSSLSPTLNYFAN